MGHSDIWTRRTVETGAAVVNFARESGACSDIASGVQRFSRSIYFKACRRLWRRDTAMRYLKVQWTLLPPAVLKVAIFVLIRCDFLGAH